MSIRLHPDSYIQLAIYVSKNVELYTNLAKSGTITTLSSLIKSLEEVIDSNKAYVTRRPVGLVQTNNHKLLSSFRTDAKKLVKALDATVIGLKQGRITSKTAARQMLRDHVKPIVEAMLASFKKYAPSGDSDQTVVGQLHRYLHPTVSRIIVEAMKRVDDDDTKSDDEARKTVRSLTSQLGKIPRTLNNKLFQIVHLSIVPDIDFKLLDYNLLTRLGIPFTVVGDNDFVVFDEQVLLAFDYEAATTADEGKRKTVDLVKRGSTLKQRKRATEHTELQEQFVIRVLDDINARSSVKYTLMTSHFEFSPHNGAIAFAWLVPLSVRTQLAARGDLAGARWGFPWKHKSTGL